MQRGAARCSEVQRDAARCSEVQRGATRCSEARRGAARCGEVRRDAAGEVPRLTRLTRKYYISIGGTCEGTVPPEPHVVAPAAHRRQCMCVCCVCVCSRRGRERDRGHRDRGVCIWKPGRAYGRALGVPICHTSGQLTWPLTGAALRGLQHRDVRSPSTPLGTHPQISRVSGCYL